MGEQALCVEWRDPWIGIPSDDAIDYVFLLVCRILGVEDEDEDEA